MLIVVNGENREFADALSLEQLITHLSRSHERLAIERNGDVVRRADWPTTMLTENDRIEIVHFVGGG